MSFVNIDLPTDSGTYADLATDGLAASFAARGITGWTPGDANFEIINIGAISLIAADLGAGAAELPPAALRALGTRLFRLQYQTGASAMVYTTWTMVDTAGYIVPAGTQVTIGGFGFQVVADVTVAPGSNTAMVLLVAADVGPDYNALTGPVATVDSLDYVLGDPTIIGSTSGGADPEDDDAYQNRLVGELALQAPRPITASDFATFTLSVPSDVLPSGVVVGRATAVDGYNAAGATFTGTTTSGSASMTSVSSFTNIAVGSAITGTNLPAFTTVISVNTGASTLVMSNRASGAGTASTITVGTLNNARYVTVFPTDFSGNALSGTAMTAIQTWLAGYRELNFQVQVQSPIYTTIFVTYRAQVLPFYDTAQMQGSINAAIASYLSPATWGSSNGGVWLNSQAGFSIVRYNKLMGVIESVKGVDYVYPGSTGLAIGTSASPTGTSDITMGGPAPLATAGTITATVVGA